MWEAATICPTPCKLTFDLSTLKVVSESRVTWATSVPILVFLCLSVLDLGPMYTTDRQMSDVRHASSLNASTLRGWGIINKQALTYLSTSQITHHVIHHQTHCNQMYNILIAIKHALQLLINANRTASQFYKKLHMMSALFKTTAEDFKSLVHCTLLR